MKKIFVLLLLSFFVSSGLMAQTRTKKVPFLPYTGMEWEQRDGIVTTQRRASSVVSTTRSPKTDSYNVIFFDKNSAEIREDQRKKLIQIGKALERRRSDFYYVTTFSSPDVSEDLATARGNAVVQSLSDFKIGEPVFTREYKKSPLLNPNRVEIR